MRRELISRIACPECRSSNWLVKNLSKRQDKSRIENGILTCKSCSRWYMISNEIAHLLPDRDISTEERRSFLEHTLRPLDAGLYKSYMAGLKCTCSPSTRDFLAHQDGLAHDSDYVKRTLGRNHILKIKKVIDLLELTDSTEVLEIGVGSGLHARYLLDQETIGSFVGVDISTKMLISAHQLIGNDNKVDLLRADVEQLPFASESFHRVSSVSTFHNLISPEKGMREVMRVLKKGGIFVSLDQNSISYENTVKRFQGILPSGLTKMSIRNLEKWLRNLGFSEVTCEHYLYTPNGPRGFYSFYDGMNRVFSKLPFLKKCSIMIASRGRKQ